MTSAIVSEETVNGKDLEAKPASKLRPQLILEMKEKAYNLCKTFLGGTWDSISCSEMVFKRISGGLTNLLYVCSLPPTSKPDPKEPKNVLMRLYGDVHDEGEEAVVKENVMSMLLSERKLGPKLYGIFKGGRLEEYIPVTCLKRKQLKDFNISKHIAQKIAEIHTLDAPISKDPAWLLKLFQRWNRGINEMISKPPENEEESIKYSRLRSLNLDGELKWLWPILEQVKSPIVFSHNDLQEGNILYDADAPTDREKVIFIDFEFCCYNYRAFDLANHFMEYTYEYGRKTYPYFDCFPEDFPTTSEKLRFIRIYLNTKDRITAGHKEITVKDVSKNPVMTAEEETLLFEIEVFHLATAYCWILWAFIHAYKSKILFGHWDFGDAKIQDYFSQKKLLLKNAKFIELIHSVEKNQI